jgi:hypothetical protein
MHSHVIAPHVQAFFADYLCHQRRLSPHTIMSCRDTFRLLLTFVRDQTGVEPSAVRMADVDAPVVLRFLTYLEGIVKLLGLMPSPDSRGRILGSIFTDPALRPPAPYP